jgi:hypothetical protein
VGDGRVRLVAEVLEIKEVDGEERIDEHGFRWKKYKRILKIIGRREFNAIKNDIPTELKGKIVEQEVWCCLDPDYSWHFTTKLGVRPLIITLSEEESEEIVEGISKN